MVKFISKGQITNYEMTRAKVLANYNKIIERYPRDHILHDYLRKTTNGMVELLVAVSKDKEELKKFKREVTKA